MAEISEIKCTKRRLSLDKKSILLTLEFVGSWEGTAITISPDNPGDGKATTPYETKTNVLGETSSPISLKIEVTDDDQKMSETDSISVARTIIDSAKDILEAMKAARKKEREAEELIIKKKIINLLAEKDDSKLAEEDDSKEDKLTKVITKVEGKGEGAKLIVTFTKPEGWNADDDFQYQFRNKKSGKSEKIYDTKATEEKNDNVATGNLTFEVELGKGVATNDKEIKTPSETEYKKYLLQLRKKVVSDKEEEKHKWATEINTYFMGRVDMSLFNNDVPLVYSSDNPGVYALQEPIIILYSDVRAEYTDLPKYWPGKPEKPENLIKANMVLHELGMDTNQGTFDFAIEANIGYEIMKGLTVERAGFIYRKRAITPQQQVLVDAQRDELRKLKLEAFLEKAAEKDKALNPSS